MEFTDSNTHSIALIDFKKNIFTAVRYPYNSDVAIDIIKRALSKYGVQQKYDIINYNCEHFANFCSYGRTSSDQAETIVMPAKIHGTSVAIGIGFALFNHLLKASYFCMLKVVESRKWISKYSRCACYFEIYFKLMGMKKNTDTGHWTGYSRLPNAHISEDANGGFCIKGSTAINYIENAKNKNKTIPDHLEDCDMNKYFYEHGNYRRMVLYSAFLSTIYFHLRKRKMESVRNCEYFQQSPPQMYYHSDEKTIIDIKVAFKLYDKTHDREKLIAEVTGLIFSMVRVTRTENKQSETDCENSPLPAVFIQHQEMYVQLMQGLRENGILEGYCEENKEDLAVELDIDDPVSSLRSLMRQFDDVKQYLEQQYPNIIDKNEYKSWSIDMTIEWIESLDDGKFMKYCNILRKGFGSDGIHASDLPRI
eukprot:109234_1